MDFKHFESSQSFSESTKFQKYAIKNKSYTHQQLEST